MLDPIIASAISVSCETVYAAAPLASIPGRVFAFITVRRTTVVRLTVIKAKTRPGIEATAPLAKMDLAILIMHAPM